MTEWTAFQELTQCWWSSDLWSYNQVTVAETYHRHKNTNLEVFLVPHSIYLCYWSLAMSLLIMNAKKSSLTANSFYLWKVCSLLRWKGLWICEIQSVLHNWKQMDKGKQPITLSQEKRSRGQLVGKEVSHEWDRESSNVIMYHPVQLVSLPACHSNLGVGVNRGGCDPLPTYPLHDLDSLYISLSSDPLLWKSDRQCILGSAWMLLPMQYYTKACR